MSKSVAKDEIDAVFETPGEAPANGEEARVPVCHGVRY